MSKFELAANLLKHAIDSGSYQSKQLNEAYELVIIKMKDS